MKVISETRRVPLIRYLHYYSNKTDSQFKLQLMHATIKKF